MSIFNKKGVDLYKDVIVPFSKVVDEAYDELTRFMDSYPISTNYNSEKNLNQNFQFH